MKDIFFELSEIRRKNLPAALVTVVAVKGCTPREPGAKMIVLKNGDIIGTVGGASMEYQAIQEALKAISDGKIRKVTYILHETEGKPSEDKIPTPMICGGEMELFIEPLTVAPTLYLFGAGHVGKPTAHLADLCGFRVIVIDPRAEMATKERFPEASEIRIQALDSASRELNSDPNGYVVIVTAGHDTDYIVLKNVLSKNFRYLGVISSRRKIGIIKQNLTKEDYTEDLISAIHSPIGLDIGSETPEEIAVSIVAELILVKNKQV
jgi:xanthine dehydrogenase accessory factor